MGIQAAPEVQAVLEGEAENQSARIGIESQKAMKSCKRLAPTCIALALGVWTCPQEKVRANTIRIGDVVYQEFRTGRNGITTSTYSVDNSDINGYGIAIDCASRTINVQAPNGMPGEKGTKWSWRGWQSMTESEHYQVFGNACRIYESVSVNPQKQAAQVKTRANTGFRLAISAKCHSQDVDLYDSDQVISRQDPIFPFGYVAYLTVNETLHSGSVLKSVAMTRFESTDGRWSLVINKSMTDDWRALKTVTTLTDDGRSVRCKNTDIPDLVPVGEIKTN